MKSGQEAAEADDQEAKRVLMIQARENEQTQIERYTGKQTSKRTYTDHNQKMR